MFHISRLLITALAELSGVALAFWMAYSLRLMRDWIPGIQLPIPYISSHDLIPYIIAGVIIWCLVGVRGGLYTTSRERSLIDEMRLVLTYSFFWFFVYIGFVYLSLGFIFVHEIPRLIILYTYIIATILSLAIRYTIHSIWDILYQRGYIAPQKVLILASVGSQSLENNPHYTYISIDPTERVEIEDLIRTGSIRSIIILDRSIDTREIYVFAKIYGISVMYPRVIEGLSSVMMRECLIGSIPMIELRSVAITPWGHLAKRGIDIIISTLSIILLTPLWIIVSIGIYINDPSGPIIYRNRRIGKHGEVFALYKFRYMYWRYCTKEDYNMVDDALSYEEQLKREKNTREGPLYKIADDPRKMWFGRIIERLSIDELPQLWNVLKGDMSIIGPRPHQPREIDLYDEMDRQVLTVSPGITGMAQVYGRDKNTFREEITLDTYYIEHYSLSLDIAILLRTILVVIRRVWR